jgi:hypothetical protein
MTIPLLVTVDVEVAADHDLDEQAGVIDELRAGLHQLGIPITAFSTAEAAERFAPQVRRLQANGHEIACHGLYHSSSEDFSRMSGAAIRRTLDAATGRIATVVGRAPRCFRGPRMTSSVTTQRALVEQGYVADFSVCSQRLDLLNCRGARLGWLSAPRRPYFPATTSPFRRGDVPIWVIPLSCVGVPFLSGVLYLAGLPAMRALFRILLGEARRTGKPIVYLFHTYEFCSRSQTPGLRSKALHRLYAQDRGKRYADTLALLQLMQAQSGVRPMTGSEYVAWLRPLDARRPTCTNN